MTKLTTKQKEIVDSLTKGFTELNEQKPTESFNVVDINALRGDVDAVVIAEKELKLYNKAMREAHNLMVEEFCKKMNEDFKKAKFPIVAVLQNLEDKEIEIEYESLKSMGGGHAEFYGDKVRMHVSKKSEEVRYGLTYIGYKTLCYQFHIEYGSSMKSTDVYYPTPQLFFTDERVKKNLIRLIRISEEFKRTGVRPRN